MSRKIRIGFSKTGNLKYIGHLDIMRCFQKIIRRAEVDICYSEGFSPHQIMSFASPLGLGLTSEGEYVDIEVNSTGSSKEMIDRLNAVTVDGIEILSYVELPEKSKPAMAMIAGADYRLDFDFQLTEKFKADFMAFLEKTEIRITKQTKKNVVEMDIKPLIFTVIPGEKDIFMQISSGSAANLKPEQVMEAFFVDSVYGELYKKEDYPYHIHRLEMYANLAKEGEQRKLIPLSEMGEIIG